MTDKEKELLSLYIKQRNHRYVFISIIILLIFIFGGIFLYSNKDKLMVPKEVYEEETKEEIPVASKNENIIIQEEKTEEKQQEVQPSTEENEPLVTQDEVSKNTQDNEVRQNTTSSSQNIQQTSDKGKKPSSKDFLFVDGYNMENVTKYATDYLTSSAWPGECIPLKDSEGVYIGMRVVFY